VDFGDVRLHLGNGEKFTQQFIIGRLDFYSDLHVHIGLGHGWVIVCETHLEQSLTNTAYMRLYGSGPRQPTSSSHSPACSPARVLRWLRFKSCGVCLRPGYVRTKLEFDFERLPWNLYSGCYALHKDYRSAQVLRIMACAELAVLLGLMA
jgi:hypothetical protein